MNNTGSGDNFEDSWRKALDRTTTTPPSRIWEGINQKLLQEELARYKRKAFNYKIAAVIAILLAATISLLNYLPPQEVNQTSQTVALLESKVPDSDSEKTLKSIGAQPTKLVTTNSTSVTNQPVLIGRPSEPAVKEVDNIYEVTGPDLARLSPEFLGSFDEEKAIGDMDVEPKRFYNMDYLFAADNSDDRKFFAGLNVGSSAVNPNFDNPPSAFESDILPTGLAISDTRTASTQTTVQSISESMDNGIGVRLGLDVGMRLSRKIILESGIQIGQTSLTSNSTYFLENNSISREIELEPETILIERGAETAFSDEQKVLTEETVTAQNRLNFASIPVEAGYLVYDQRLSLALKAGVLSNVYLGHDVVNVEDKTSARVTPGDDSPYRMLSFSGVAGIALGYNLFGGFDMTLEPSYRHNIQPITKSSADFNSALTGVGIMAGIRYNFR